MRTGLRLCSLNLIVTLLILKLMQIFDQNLFGEKYAKQNDWKVSIDQTIDAIAME